MCCSRVVVVASSLSRYWAITHSIANCRNCALCSNRMRAKMHYLSLARKFIDNIERWTRWNSVCFKISQSRTYPHIQSHRLDKLFDCHDHHAVMYCVVCTSQWSRYIPQCQSKTVLLSYQQSISFFISIECPIRQYTARQHVLSLTMRDKTFWQIATNCSYYWLYNSDSNWINRKCRIFCISMQVQIDHADPADHNNS